MKVKISREDILGEKNIIVLSYSVTIYKSSIQ